MTDLITVEGGPERFFRVSRPTADGEVCDVPCYVMSIDKNFFLRKD
jgi:hypothetical protein